MFYKYHGAGNDFLIADGRTARIELTAGQIAALCDRHTGFGADGVMVLENSERYDFAMRYYNPDGSGGMMCGNGGRCIAAFAADLGYTSFKFEAPDGCHEAELFQPGPSAAFSGSPRTIRLKMSDVSGAVAFRRADYAPSGRCSADSHGPHHCGAGVSGLRLSGMDWYLDTGTRHLVRFVQDLDSCDVAGEGRGLRYDGRFAPVGVNVNFVRIDSPGEISVRTYEKGVEAETLACGTGIVASAIASWLVSAPGVLRPADGSTIDAADSFKADAGDLSAGLSAPSDTGAVRCRVHARIADLSVSFVPVPCCSSPVPCCCSGEGPLSGSADAVQMQLAAGGRADIPFTAAEVCLTGPAAFIGTVQTDPAARSTALRHPVSTR